jgi:histidyl-tRNA synthetase
MSEKIYRPRGTRDILPEEAQVYQYLEDVSRDIFCRYGYDQIRIPAFEDVNLFSRSIGETTDIVQKEMYVFKDKKGREMALRPEGTAGIVRAYIENNLAKKFSVLKVYHYGPMFRYERPQAGRYREFYQVGAEYFGNGQAAADAEIIFLAMNILSAVGVDDLKLFINSIGCSECRGEYRKALIENLKPRVNEFCDDCRVRLALNPFRVLDCKIDRDKIVNLPKIKDYLCDNCLRHFERLGKLLKAGSCDYEIDERLVRGIDYYTRTIFEIKTGTLAKTEDTIVGGGRYDGLAGNLGGADTFSCGFALGVERVVALIGKKYHSRGKISNRIFVAVTDEKMEEAAVRLCQILRKEELTVIGPFSDRSLKSQLRAANTFNANFTIILGEKELGEGKLIVRNMANQTQKEVLQSKIFGALK